MKLFSIFKSRDKPATNRTTGSAYSFFMGGSSAGKNVNERTAMQMTAVYACVRILSEAVAGLPLHLYRYTEDGSKEKALDNNLYSLLHDEPNPEMSSFVFRETLMTHLLLWGNAYAQIIRNGKGEVMALYPLMPNKMEVSRDENGQLYYQYSRSTDEANAKDSDSSVKLSPYDVLHIPGLGFDGLVGYSPIAMAKNAIGMAIACEEFGAKFFSNGASPSGVLEHPGILKDPFRRIQDTSPKGGERMNGIPSRKEIERLRSLYREGARVELVSMDDIQAPPVGTRGTVRFVDDIGSVHVSWDNGSSLALAYGVDSCWILSTVTTKCYGEQRVWDSRQEAMDFFLEGMLACEGSEADRYSRIYAQLKDGAQYASDED